MANLDLDDEEIFNKKLSKFIDRPIYECIGKGGSYIKYCKPKGSGTSRGNDIIVYKCLDSGKIYYRTVEDFNNRMRKKNA